MFIIGIIELGHTNSETGGGGGLVVLHFEVKIRLHVILYTYMCGRRR